MRHVLLSGTVTAAAFGVGKAAATAGLVAPARLTNRVTSGRLRTVRGAINLATVAVAANDHLRPTAHAEKESARGFHWRPKARQGGLDRGFKLVKYSPCTRAQARRGARHRSGLGGLSRCRACSLRRCLSTASRTRLSSPPAAARQRARLQSPYGLLPTRPLPAFGKSTKPKVTNITKNHHRLHRSSLVAIFTRISTAIHTFPGVHARAVAPWCAA